MILCFDKGVTKYAIITAEYDDKNIQIISKEKNETDSNMALSQMIVRTITLADKMTYVHKIERIGISCSGPLDSKRGIITSLPNLLG